MKLPKEPTKLPEESTKFPKEPTKPPKEPTKLPEEHQEKHWLILKVAAVCSCYKEPNSYANHSYDTRSYPEFFRTLVEVDTVANNPPLVRVKESHMCESDHVAEEPAESPEELQENQDIS